MKLSNIFIIAIVVFASAGAAQYLFQKQDLPIEEKMTAASMQDDLNRVQAIIDQAKQNPISNEPRRNPFASPLSAKTDIHKCVKDETTIYSDKACPKDMQQQPIKNGTYNVVASVKVKGKPSKQATTYHDKALQQQLGAGY